MMRFTGLGSGLSSFHHIAHHLTHTRLCLPANLVCRAARVRPAHRKVGQAHQDSVYLVADTQLGQVSKAARLGIARGADDAIVLLQQKLCKIGTVLSGDAADLGGAGLSRSGFIVQVEP
jgi:hypothetical protein